MEDFTISQTPFAFSGVGISALEQTEYTVVCVAVDVSSSVALWQDDLRACLAQIVEACRRSPRADHLLLRLVQFNQNTEEVFGYRDLASIKPSDLAVSCYGMTALYDATLDAIGSVETYGAQLFQNDFDVNGIVFVLTDGERNSGVYANPSVVGERVQKIRRTETGLESILTILVGVGARNDPQLDGYLNDFKREGAFDQYVSVEQADAKTLAKLADFVSMSISSQSQALGSVRLPRSSTPTP